MRRHETGTTLVEVLVAVVIVSFGLLALMKFNGSLLAGQAVSMNRTEGQLLAEEVLSEIAAMPVPASYGSGSDEVQGKRATFTRTWEIETGSAGEALITVSAAWVGAHGGNGEVTLSSVVTKDVRGKEAKLAEKGDSIYGPGSNPTPPWSADFVGDAVDLPPSDSEPGTPDTPSEGDPTDATFHTISGSLTLRDGATKDHVRVSGTEGALCAMGTTSYSCKVPNAWTGTIITVTTGGFVSNPGSIAYSNLTASRANQNYTISK